MFAEIEIQHLASNIIFQSSPTCPKVFKKSALFTNELKVRGEKRMPANSPTLCRTPQKDTTQTWPESEVEHRALSERPQNCPLSTPSKTTMVCSLKALMPFLASL